MEKSAQELFEKSMLPLSAVSETDLTQAMAAKRELEQLRAALRKLPSRQRRLLCMRFGFTSNARTVEQVAARMGLSTDDTELLEQQALRMLRKEMLK